MFPPEMLPVSPLEGFTHKIVAETDVLEAPPLGFLVSAVADALYLSCRAVIVEPPTATDVLCANTGTEAIVINKQNINENAAIFFIDLFIFLPSLIYFLTILYIPDGIFG